MALVFEVEDRSVATSSTATVSAELASSNLPAERRPTGVFPAAIPSSQRYYWTSRWQRDEAESRASHMRGEAREFEDPNAAIHWLLSD